MTDDKLLINDLLVRGIVGLNDWEREKKQDILINLTVFVDTRAAGESDDVEDSLNYRTLTKAIIRYALPEIAILDFGAEGVRIRVEKVGALRFARSVGVEIERRRADFE